ncbi:MAG: hypothetical protein WD775_08125 [Burkholderiales bacterium]
MTTDPVLAGSLRLITPGPGAMTAAMQAMLKDIGLPEDAVRSEEFYGY